tara:strand:+ start:1961 stop:3109 length:1149 start_codon:yes stop_codon:yes gene_type:complete
MKIAFLTDGIYPFVVGGMQKHSYCLAKELVVLGNQVDLFHSINYGENIPSSNFVNNVFFKGKHKFKNIYCINFPKSFYFPGHYLYNSYKYSSWILNILEKHSEKYDVIYSQGFTSWKLLFNKNKIKSKIYVNFHGFEMYQYAPNLKTKIEQFLYRPIVKNICANSDFVFSFGGKISHIIKSIGINSSKIINSFNGISPFWIIKKNNFLTNEPLRFLFIGRNERRKGYKELCNALLEINSNSLEFHFVGEIPINQRLSIYNHSLIYHGLIKEDAKKMKIFDQCDVLICPSFSEGMPTVILEAMSRGMVILASNVGAIDAMVSEKNGILMNGNSKSEIVKAIHKILSKNKHEIKLLKNCSIELVNSNFTWKKIAEDLNIKLLKM